MCRCAHPTNKALLKKFQLSSGNSAPQLLGTKFKPNFVAKCRPSMDKDVCKVDIHTQLPFCIPPLLVGHFY